LRPLKALFLVWLPACLAATVVTFEVMWMRTVWVPLVPLLLGATLSYGFGTVYLELAVEREQARLRRAWSRRVSPEVLQVILGNPRLTQVKGRRVTGTVFFSDLQDFTTFCHSCPPETVIAQINEYLGLATQVIRGHGGTLHKFIGDGVMAVFGDPVPHEDHAKRAVAAAVELQQKMADLRAQQPEGAWPMFMRIGLHTGELVAGDIGSEDLLEYTVMGDTVSTASRLEGLNKEFGTWIMLSGATAAQLGGSFELLALGQVQARGRAELIEAYTVREGQSDEKQ
jgi:adenylate cyclase